jgi:hypothetical protein
MLKAHQFEWAFGFGHRQNTGPESGEQEKPSRQKFFDAPDLVVPPKRGGPT